MNPFGFYKLPVKKRTSKKTTETPGLLKGWWQGRHLSNRLLKEINGDIGQQKDLSDKLRLFENYEDLKNANLGKLVARLFTGVMILMCVALVVSFARAREVLVEFKLNVAAVSFRGNGPIDLDSMIKSGQELFLQNVSAAGDWGTIDAGTSSPDRPVFVHFQQQPDTCHFLLDYLSPQQLYIRCSEFSERQNFKGSLVSYDTIQFLPDSGEVTGTGFNGIAFYFDRGRSREDLVMINVRPAAFAIGPFYADRIRLSKPIDESGNSRFSLNNGTIRFLEGKGDSILLSSLDTLGFEMTEPVRLRLANKQDGSIDLYFQANVKKLIAGPLLASVQENDRMPRKGELWLEKMPGYLPEAILTGIISLALLLVIRQRRAS